MALANIWKIIGGDPHGKDVIPLQRSKVFMCSIQNFHIDWIIDTEREIEKVDVNKLGRIDDNNLFMRPEEITHISKKYVQLYKNRLEKLAFDKKR